jgi:hypothetical protein
VLTVRSLGVAYVASTDEIERRARLSLHFLELAASAGYGDAFREMCKAHKLLYTEMKAKIN